MIYSPACLHLSHSLAVLKEAMFQDKAMAEIRRPSRRLYKFTKTPYARCTSLKSIKWEHTH